jgi:cytidylate kinase
MTLVAISGTYGAGGSEIAPALASRLSVGFLDRAIPAAVAEALGVPIEEAQAHDEQPAGSWLERLLRGFAGLDSGAPTTPPAADVSAEDFHRATERVLRAQIASGEGVILGRAAVVLLADDAAALKVRLDGPRERRVHQAMRLQGIDEQTARQRLARQDRAHADYARRFYGTDMGDPRHYHLMLDSTALPLGACVEILVLAARSLSERTAGAPAVR